MNGSGEEGGEMDRGKRKWENDESTRKGRERGRYLDEDGKWEREFFHTIAPHQSYL